MKACKDIDFLNSYWLEAKRIARDVEENLPKGIGEVRKPIVNKGSIKMYIVNFNDLGDTWSPKDVIDRVGGRSSKLERLANKIVWMIYNNNSEDIKPMIEKTCKVGYFSIGRNWKDKKKEVLNPMEIKHLKDYFKF